MRTNELLSRLEDRPFRPFRIHVSDGTVLDVPEPWSISVGRTAAMIASRFQRDEEGHVLATRWRLVDLVHVTQISDLDEDRNGRRARRKRR
jgi:hypothetical protein